MKSRALVFILLFSVGAQVCAVNFSRINVAWQYDLNAELQLAHRVVQRAGSSFVLVRIKADSLAPWNYDFLVQDGYESEEEELITPDIDTLFYEKNQVILNIGLPRLAQDLFVIKIHQFDRWYYYDVSLKIGTLAFPSIFPLDKDGLPLLGNYVNRSGHRWDGNDLYAVRFVEDFGPADAPMADMMPLAPSLRRDSSFSFGNSPTFKENYLYVVREDSNASTGVTILRTPPYFPEYRQLKELVECMLYLTSEAERKEMLNSRDLKKSFDSFWINNFGTKPRARNAIRRYYAKIKRANLLFTDFKPGWKTDRGMMYIIFNAPDEVYRTNGLEEWYYDSGDFFEYNIISSFFAPRTYTLRRGKELEDPWYERIAAFRSGINE